MPSMVSGSASYDLKCSDLAEIIGKLGEVIWPSGFSGLGRSGHGKALDIGLGCFDFAQDLL